MPDDKDVLSEAYARRVDRWCTGIFVAFCGVGIVGTILSMLYERPEGLTLSLLFLLTGYGHALRASVMRENRRIYETLQEVLREKGA